MDELEIGGKRYISSRRAAKEHKYHIDYIGQLIRAGRVMGKKVGRSWYVEEQSLNVYLKQEAGGKGYIAPVAVEEVVEVEAPKEELPAAVEEVSAASVPVIQEIEVGVFTENEQEVIAPSAPQEVAELPIAIEEKEEVAPVQLPDPKPIYKAEANEQKVNVTIAEKKAVQKPAATLTYIEDTEPLLPVLEGRQRRNADFVPVLIRRSKETVHEEQILVEPTEEEMPVKEEIYPAPSPMRAVFALGALGIVVLLVVAVGSTVVATSIHIAGGGPASVSFTIK